MSSYSGPIVDVDVHHTWGSSRDLMEYLPRQWHEYSLGSSAGGPLNLLPNMDNINMVGNYIRGELIQADGRSPGSKYDVMRRTLLDRLGITRLMLNYDVGLESAYYNPYFAAALCAAANQWSADHWLSLPDDRVWGSVLVPTELAEEGAAEVRKWAGSARVGQVLMVGNPLAKPFGHPHYHPIYAAAAEAGLPIAVHVGGEKATKSAYTAGGHAGSYFERKATGNQAGMHHLTSFITHGVFEKFPSLKVLIVEFGFSWLPPLVWRLDSIFGLLRAECPLVRRLPSEYVRDHVRMSTQPLDSSRAPQVIESFPDYEHILCFSTDFPHFDGDEPRQLANKVPREWLPKVYYQNAAGFYGWEPGTLVDNARALSMAG
jgi:uncharacterized protein